MSFGDHTETIGWITLLLGALGVIARPWLARRAATRQARQRPVGPPCVVVIVVVPPRDGATAVPLAGALPGTGR